MEGTSRGRLTVLFTKRPEPGRVKTRLEPLLGPAGAARLAEAMLADALERNRSGPFRNLLCVAPAEAVDWARARFPGFDEVEPQVGADLGERLAHGARRAFAVHGARTLVVVGSDQPLVPLARLVEAHVALEAGTEVVLGPDRGGGYYLIGLRAPCDALFSAVAMSSTGMAAATAVEARARGLTLAHLALHDDVDTPEDLRRLVAALAEAPAELARHTRVALDELALRTSGPAP